MTWRSRLAAVVGMTLAAIVAVGCSQMHVDDSYETEIPAALEAAEIGITDASAGITLDGFSETLVVGGTINGSAMSGDDVSPPFVQRVIAVALEDGSFDTRYFGLALRLSRYEFVDTDSALTELGGSPRSDGSITMEEAKRIAQGGSD